VVLDVHAPKEDRTDDVKDSFYEELERVFDKFLKMSYENSVRRFQCQSKQGGHSNRQLGIKVYTKLVMTMELEE
jgi:hypothetical protein